MSRSQRSVPPVPRSPDKGYDLAANRAACRRRGIIPVIPYRENAKNKSKFFPRLLYKTRARVEQTIGKLKRFKRVAMRCDKTQDSYGAFVAFACSPWHDGSCQMNLRSAAVGREFADDLFDAPQQPCRFQSVTYPLQSIASVGQSVTSLPPSRSSSHTTPRGTSLVAHAPDRAATSPLAPPQNPWEMVAAHPCPVNA